MGLRQPRCIATDIFSPDWLCALHALRTIAPHREIDLADSKTRRQSRRCRQRCIEAEDAAAAVTAKMGMGIVLRLQSGRTEAGDPSRVHGLVGESRFHQPVQHPVYCDAVEGRAAEAGLDVLMTERPVGAMEQIEDAHSRWSRARACGANGPNRVGWSWAVLLHTGQLITARHLMQHSCICYRVASAVSELMPLGTPAP